MFHVATRTAPPTFGAKLISTGNTLFVGCGGPIPPPFCDCDELPVALGLDLAATPFPFPFAAAFGFADVFCFFRAGPSSSKDSASDSERGSSSEGLSALFLDAAARFGGIMDTEAAIWVGIDANERKRTTRTGLAVTWRVLEPVYWARAVRERLEQL